LKRLQKAGSIITVSVSHTSSLSLRI